jgi:hypothetical protein
VRAVLPLKCPLDPRLGETAALAAMVDERPVGYLRTKALRIMLSAGPARFTPASWVLHEAFFP